VEHFDELMQRGSKESKGKAVSRNEVRLNLLLLIGLSFLIALFAPFFWIIFAALLIVAFLYSIREWIG